MDHTIVEVISELMVVTGVNIAFAMRASGIQSLKVNKVNFSCRYPPFNDPLA